MNQRAVARSTATVIAMVLGTALLLLLVYETRRVLVWIIIAAFFATALSPLVSWLERRVSWVRRWLATLAVFLVVFVLLGGLVTLFVLPRVREGTAFADRLPGMIDDARAGRGAVGELLARFHVVNWVRQHQADIKGYTNGLGGTAMSF